MVVLKMSSYLRQIITTSLLDLGVDERTAQQALIQLATPRPLTRQAPIR